MKNLMMLGALAVFVVWGVGQLDPNAKGYKTVFQAIKAKPAEAQEIVQNQTTFARSSHENQNSICINNRTREHYKGELVGRDEVIHELSKHFTGDQIEIMSAITISEGQRDLNCIGDEVEYLNGRRLYGAKTADGRTWGASLGLFQIRTIQEDNTPGSCRNDATIMASIQEQVRCAKEIYNSQGYRAWSQYSNGNYKKHLGK